MELLTRKQVAELLKVSEPTVDSWRKKGLIVAIKIERVVRFKRSDIEELFNHD